MPIFEYVNRFLKVINMAFKTLVSVFFDNSRPVKR